MPPCFEAPCSPILTREGYLNHLQVTVTCSVAGQYALWQPENWPAQLLACGSPPGSQECLSTDYNASFPTLTPTLVTYAGGVYTATYTDSISPAWIPPMSITPRCKAEEWESGRVCPCAYAPSSGEGRQVLTDDYALLPACTPAPLQTSSVYTTARLAPSRACRRLRSMW